MSEFKCEVVKIDEVVRHPNADKLIICKIKGYNCISSDLDDGTPRYKAGDYVVYIPEASLVPEWMLKKMGFWKDGKGMLSGSNGNRVKIVKLRGEYSQGIMYPVSMVYQGSTWDNEQLVDLPPAPIIIRDNESPGGIDATIGEDVSEFLGITKYEPVIPQSMQGQVGNLFGYTKSYDIESLQNFPELFEDGEEVVVTEKLHGTLCQIGFVRNPPESAIPDMHKVSDTIYAYVTSKGLAKSGLIQKNSDTNQSNVYVKIYNEVFKKTFLGQQISCLMGDDNPVSSGPNFERLWVFGEIFGPGIQKGYHYGKKLPTFKVFDVCIKSAVGSEEQQQPKYLDDNTLENFLKETQLERVPVLYKGPFSMAKMLELRDGKTMEDPNANIREGIVIRAAIEENLNIRGLHDGRKQVKFVSPAYKMTEDENAIS